ncbi:MAG TPA: SpoIIE family protein phosphatase [Terriglobia bacterium]|nr:SpoIIE family protein phosphatase [Terriglobia bacterium]
MFRLRRGIRQTPSERGDFTSIWIVSGWANSPITSSFGIVSDTIRREKPRRRCGLARANSVCSHWHSFSARLPFAHNFPRRQLSPPFPERIPPTRRPLGLIPGTGYEQTAVRLAKGDLLILYTDGVTECSSASRTGRRVLQNSRTVRERCSSAALNGRGDRLANHAGLPS